MDGFFLFCSGYFMVVIGKYIVVLGGELSLSKYVNWEEFVLGYVFDMMKF